MLTVPDSLILFLLLMNGGVFLLYVADKRRARTGAWRIPETTLLCSAALGPFGAFLAMQAFRHKTRHLKFFVVPLFCIVQILAVLWLVAGFF